MRLRRKRNKPRTTFLELLTPILIVLALTGIKSTTETKDYAAETFNTSAFGTAHKYGVPPLSALLDPDTPEGIRYYSTNFVDFFVAAS